MNWFCDAVIAISWATILSSDPEFEKSVLQYSDYKDFLIYAAFPETWVFKILYLVNVCF